MSRSSQSRPMMESLESRELFAAISVPDISVAAGATTANFQVNVLGTVTKTLTLKFVAIDGTAHGKRDFVYTKSTVTVAPGASSAMISIPLINDPVYSSLRSFKVHIDVEGSSGQGITATANIVGATPTISLAKVEYSSRGSSPNPNTVAGPYVEEPSSGKRLVIFTFLLSQPITKTVSFRFATSNDTAVAGRNYVATSGLVTFKPGETMKKVGVTLLTDKTAEARTDFNLTLSSIVNATAAAAPSLQSPGSSKGTAGVTTVFIRGHLTGGKPDPKDIVPTGVQTIVIG